MRSALYWQKLIYRNEMRFFLLPLTSFGQSGVVISFSQIYLYAVISFVHQKLVELCSHFQAINDKDVIVSNVFIRFARFKRRKPN